MLHGVHVLAHPNVPSHLLMIQLAFWLYPAEWNNRCTVLQDAAYFQWFNVIHG